MACEPPVALLFCGSDLGKPLSETTPKQRYMDYMRVLFTGLGVMHSLLAEISPSFVVCNRYDEIGVPESAARIADFIAPSASVAKMVAKSMAERAHPHENSTESLPYQDAAYVEMRLQLKLDVIDSTYCRRD